MHSLRHLLIVDDDLLSREVLSVVAKEAGFSVEALDSGEAALAHLALHRGSPPSAMLVDMQMPGLSGNALAARLRAMCGGATVLVAMSGTAVLPEAFREFDTFLQKPFDFASFVMAFEGAPQLGSPPLPAKDVLSEATYSSLAHSMTKGQLRELYTMCLDDAERRLRLLHAAALAGDEEEYRRGAHSIKGGCGMVGALELASLAARMEDAGPPPIDNLDALDELVDQFLHASSRLRSMLDSRPE